MLKSVDSSPSSKGSSDYEYDMEPEPVSVLEIKITQDSKCGIEIS